MHAKVAAAHLRHAHNFRVDRGRAARQDNPIQSEVEMKEATKIEWGYDWPRHAAGLPPPDADPRPGDYFVTVRRDDGESRFLLGPFDEHVKALKRVEEVRRYACTIDPRAPFYAFGTCRMGRRESTREGIFNSSLGVDPPNWREQESECAPESQPSQ
jgi:hypothetical protein